MKKYGMLVLIAGLIVVGVAFVFQQTDASATTVVVYKSPTCGCCEKWVDHLEAAGFNVEVHNQSDLSQVKAQNGVRPEFSSCHTALVNGYVIEGHVPAEQIVRLLAEKPAILGLTAPGMPVGSPGMEVPGQSQSQPYDVLTFDGSGKTTVYAHVN